MDLQEKSGRGICALAGRSHATMQCQVTSGAGNQVGSGWFSCRLPGTERRRAGRRVQSDGQDAVRGEGGAERSRRARARACEERDGRPLAASAACAPDPVWAEDGIRGEDCDERSARWVAKLGLNNRTFASGYMLLNTHQPAKLCTGWHPDVCV